MNPAASSKALCHSFRELAAWTFHKLERAKQVGMPFNEETITESLLLKLAERHGGRELKIKAYTKREEGTGTKDTGGKPTGADWSFWFADHHGYGVEVRIQAKRLYPSGRYGNLNGNGKQIQTLRKNCGTAIPLYVFYNGPFVSPACRKRILGDYWNRSCHGCLHRPLNGEDWGCSFAPISAIPKNGNPFPEDIHGMRPWHCLVCACYTGSCSSAASLPQRVSSALENIYGGTAQKTDDRFSGAPDISFELRPNAPEWVAKLMVLTEDDLTPADEALEAILDEHGLRGVAVLRELEPRDGG
jgi:hypothetical protein